MVHQVFAYTHCIVTSEDIISALNVGALSTWSRALRPLLDGTFADTLARSFDPVLLRGVALIYIGDIGSDPQVADSNAARSYSKSSTE